MSKKMIRWALGLVIGLVIVLNFWDALRQRDPSYAFLRAAQTGRVDTMSKLLQREVDVNLRDRSGRTALMYAIFNGHRQAVELLLRAGADVNAQEWAYGWTPLRIASLKGNNAFVQLLLDREANVNARAKNGSTALFEAAHLGKVEIARLLINHGADVDARDRNGDTALIIAASRSHKDAVEMLIAKGADIAVVNVHGWTALRWTEARKRPDIAELIKKAERAKSGSD